MFRRRTRAQKLWKVEIQGLLTPRIRSTRSRISPAALLVKVIARIPSGRDAVPDQVGDPVGDDAGLAAPRPGEDEERTLDVGDGLPLGRVEEVEDRVAGAAGIGDRGFDHGSPGSRGDGGAPAAPDRVETAAGGSSRWPGAPAGSGNQALAALASGILARAGRVVKTGQRRP